MEGYNIRAFDLGMGIVKDNINELFIWMWKKKGFPQQQKTRNRLDAIKTCLLTANYVL